MFAGAFTHFSMMGGFPNFISVMPMNAPNTPAKMEGRGLGRGAGGLGDGFFIREPRGRYSRNFKSPTSSASASCTFVPSQR